MGWFGAFREGGTNTYYESKRTAVTIDLDQIIVSFFSLVVLVALLILVIGSRGRERWTTLLRLVFSLHTCVVILLCVYGHGWQSGTITSRCHYTSTYHGDINARLGLHLALKNINITLTGDINLTDSIGHIDYNERFSIDKVSKFEEQYHTQLERGLPWPILSIAEYFYEDTGGLRWMRNIHEAGHFTYIILWCSLVFWTMGNILIGFVVSRGALFITCSGLSLVCACVVYATLQPAQSLVIPIAGAFLTISYGWCFFLAIVSGVVTTCSGIAVLFALFYKPVATSLLFLVDTSSLCEEHVYTDTSQAAGPLQIKSPYTERRSSFQHLPHSYSNPAFGQLPQSSAVKQRSFSFDFGNITSQRQPIISSLGMTSISEQDDDETPSTSHPKLLHHKETQLDSKLNNRHQSKIKQSKPGLHALLESKHNVDKCSEEYSSANTDDCENNRIDIGKSRDSLATVITLSD